MENALKQPVNTQETFGALSPKKISTHWRFFGVILIGVALMIGAFFAPAFPFTSDGATHAAMARAFAENGAFYIADNAGVDGAPPLQAISTHVLGDYVYPQYPSGYGVIAAPFYAALGLRGLVILNALSAALALFLAYRIALSLYGKNVSTLTIPILALATFFTNYAFGIWPHMFSLFVWLAVAYLAISADSAETAKSRLSRIAAAGLIVGFSACIRVDLILAAPVVLLWLRLFARPADRITAGLFISMLAPGLIAAAFMNGAKFGVYSPFYYGPNPGPDSLSRYVWLAPVVIIGTLGLFALNAPKTIAAIRSRISDAKLIIGGGMCALIVFAAGLPLTSTYLFSLYVLVFDLQLYNGYYVQEGVARDPYGYLLFWGFPKRALVQSLPYAALALIPIVEIFRGQNLKQHSLCALAICAPICFYAMNQWHGGGSYNMRYFLPAVPFIAMLSAYALLKISKAAGDINRTHLLAAGVAGAFLFEIFDTIRQDFAPQFFTPLALYPQLAIAFILAIVVTLYIVTNAKQQMAKITFMIAITALSYAGMVNLTDESGHEKARGEQLAVSRAAAQSIPSNALVLTQMPVLMIDSESNGASIMYSSDKNIDASVQAVMAFARAGRCVYFQNNLVSNRLSPHLGAGDMAPRPYWAGKQEFPEDARLAFYGLADQAENCAF